MMSPLLHCTEAQDPHSHEHDQQVLCKLVDFMQLVLLSFKKKEKKFENSCEFFNLTLYSNCNAENNKIALMWNTE